MRLFQRRDSPKLRGRLTGALIMSVYEDFLPQSGQADSVVEIILPLMCSHLISVLPLCASNGFWQSSQKIFIISLLVLKRQKKERTIYYLKLFSPVCQV